MGISSSKSNDELVDTLVKGRQIRTRDVERAFRLVDRGRFMPKDAISDAYKDTPYKAGEGDEWQPGRLHLSAPTMYAAVLERLDLKPGHAFLNIGSGSGWLSTAAGFLLGAKGVNHGIEIHSNLVDYANAKLKETLEKPEVHAFDWTKPIFIHGNALTREFSVASQLSYDRIYCGAALNDNNGLKRIIKMLRINGKLVSPVGNRLLLYTRTSESRYTARELMSCQFADLIRPLPEESSAMPPVPRVLTLREMCRVAIRREIRGKIMGKEPVFMRTVVTQEEDEQEQERNMNRDLNHNDRDEAEVGIFDDHAVLIHAQNNEGVVLFRENRPRNDDMGNDNDGEEMPLDEEEENEDEGPAHDPLLGPRPRRQQLPPFPDEANAELNEADILAQGFNFIATMHRQFDEERGRAAREANNEAYEARRVRGPGPARLRFVELNRNDDRDLRRHMRAMLRQRQRNQRLETELLDRQREELERQRRDALDREIAELQREETEELRRMGNNRLMARRLENRPERHVVFEMAETMGGDPEEEEEEGDDRARNRDENDDIINVIDSDETFHTASDGDGSTDGQEEPDSTEQGENEEEKESRGAETESNRDRWDRELEEEESDRGRQARDPRGSREQRREERAADGNREMNIQLTVTLGGNAREGARGREVRMHEEDEEEENDDERRLPRSYTWHLRGVFADPNEIFAEEPRRGAPELSAIHLYQPGEQRRREEEVGSSTNVNMEDTDEGLSQGYQANSEADSTQGEAGSSNHSDAGSATLLSEPPFRPSAASQPSERPQPRSRLVDNLPHDVPHFEDINFFGMVQRRFNVTEPPRPRQTINDRFRASETGRTRRHTSGDGSDRQYHGAGAAKRRKSDEESDESLQTPTKSKPQQECEKQAASLSAFYISFCVATSTLPLPPALLRCISQMTDFK